MALTTDDKNGTVAEVMMQVPEPDINKIFALAKEIERIEVHYDHDPLVTANEAIDLMRQYASTIAAISGGYLR